MAQLSDLVRPGCRVALADGVGSPRSVSGELSDVAAAAGDVSLLLGWTPVADPLLRFDVFADVRTLMPGWGLRPAIDAGQAHAPPVRLSTVPALLHGPLRPDVLVASVVPHVDGGYFFATEVSWLRAAVDAGARVAGVLATA
ncbi:MAG: acetyl-CoA hydrolase, partial [Jatrophihabitans sp.]